MNLDLQSVFQLFHPELFAKIVLLILIGLYIIFIIMLQYQLRSLRRIVVFPSRAGSFEIQIFALTYLTAIIVLFVVTLLIV